MFRFLKPLFGVSSDYMYYMYIYQCVKVIKWKVIEKILNWLKCLLTSLIFFISSTFLEIVIIIADNICWIVDTIIFMVIHRMRRGLIVSLVSNCSSGRSCTLSLGAGLQTRHRRRQYNNVILNNIAWSPGGKEGGIIYQNDCI